MRAQPYCSACGEEVKNRRATAPLLRVLCARCAPRFRGAYALLVLLLGLCAGAGFGLGRYTSARQPFYFIGAPIDMKSDDSPPSTAPLNQHAKSSRQVAPPSLPEPPSAMTSADETETICGAPTKSGRPCQHKVRGWGYCWQHRDKYGPKPPPAQKAEAPAAQAKP